MNIKLLNNPPHHIVVDAFSLQKLMWLAKNYKLEFTSFLYCEKDNETKEFFLHTPWFPKQNNNSSVYTDPDGSALIDLMVEEGLDISLAAGHVHTHPNIPTSPSGTDEEEIFSRAKASTRFNCSLIINEKEEIFSHIVDIEDGMYMRDVPILIKYPHELEDMESYRLQVIQKLTNLGDIKNFLSLSDWKVFEELYPLSKEDVDTLKRVIDVKFKPKKAVGFQKTPAQDWYDEYNRGSKWYDQRGRQYKSFEDIIAAEKEDEGDYIDFSMDIDDMTEEGLFEYIDYLADIPLTQMTDKEFKDFQILCGEEDLKF